MTNQIKIFGIPGRYIKGYKYQKEKLRSIRFCKRILFKIEKVKIGKNIETAAVMCIL